MRMEEAEAPGKRQVFAYKFQVRLCSSVYFTRSLGFLSLKIRYHQMCTSHFLYILLKNIFIWRKKGISKNAEKRMCAVFFPLAKVLKEHPWLICAELNHLAAEKNSFIHSLSEHKERLLVLVPGVGTSVNSTPCSLPLPSYCWQFRHFTYFTFNSHNSSCQAWLFLLCKPGIKDLEKLSDLPSHKMIWWC